MPAKVIVRDLRKRYGEVEAANGVNFDVRQGEIFGLLGPNGAGKTTTIECVVGLREPDDGQIEVSGIDARRYPGEVKQKIGAALQTTSLQDKITPREALRVFGSFYREKFNPQQLLDRFALADKADSAFDTLSGGQRQRLALALAFVNKPELIFLDEPTTGLDPQARRDLHADIVSMKRDGHTVLLTTHNIFEAERLCDRIAVMNQGRIVAAGTPRELIARSTAATSVFLSTVQPIDRSVLADIQGVQDVAIEDKGFRFSALEVTHTLAGLMECLNARGIELAELHVQKATLEDVLIELTGNNRGNG
jgi:ABC-2 type transport system ATP-binding protein